MKPQIASLIVLMLLFSSLGLAAEKGRLRVFYSANRQGEIEPCDCQVHQTGGLNRVQAFIEDTLKQAAEESTLFVDSGDTFFSAPTLNPSRRDQELLRAKVIAQSYRLMKLDAMTPGERDFALGLDTLNELRDLSGAVFLAANVADASGRQLFEPYHLFQRGNLKIAVVGLVDEEALRGVVGIKVQPWRETWVKLYPMVMGERPDAVIVLSHLGLKQDRELVKNSGTDFLVFGSHSLDVPTDSGPTMRIFQPMNAGAQLGEVEFDPKKQEIVRHQLVDLTQEFDRANTVRKLIENYKAQVRSLAMETMGANLPVKPSVTFVANAYVCKNCHQKQYDFWKTTKHASAYLVLYAKTEHFDSECIGCHSLGFGADRGFRSVVSPLVLQPPEYLTKGEVPFVEKMMSNIFRDDGSRRPLDSRLEPERYAALKARYHASLDTLEASGRLVKAYLGVQCEHCHGNRLGHPGIVTQKKVLEKTCRGCHAAPNAPDFTLSMFSKVSCPRR